MIGIIRFEGVYGKVTGVNERFIMGAFIDSLSIKASQRFWELKERSFSRGKESGVITRWAIWKEWIAVLQRKCTLSGCMTLKQMGRH